MKSYKLQIWLEGDFEDDEGQFRDFYFDVEKITGFFIPDDKDEMLPERGINIFFEGDIITIKQEPHIMKYLKELFGDNAIKP